MSKNLLKLGVLGISALTFAAIATAANAQDKIRWKMPSAFPSSVPHLGPSGQRFAKDIERMSGGKFDQAYMRTMIQDHVKDVEEFQRASKEAKDPEVKRFAEQTLPILQEHLKMAKDIESQHKKGKRMG